MVRPRPPKEGRGRPPRRRRRARQRWRGGRQASRMWRRSRAVRSSVGRQRNTGIEFRYTVYVSTFDT
eukprot:5150538-Prymnesium_polylepis.1